MDTEIDSGALTGFDNFIFDLFSHFGNHFLDASRVDTAIGYELVESKAGDFAANRVKA